MTERFTRPDWVRRINLMADSVGGMRGDLGLAATDAAYALAPFAVGPDEALVIRGRWPRCRYANVSLWNRHLQSLDYANRSISLNRAQMVADADRRFTAVISHTDPCSPNWLDTEGRPFGIAFWRFMLPEGEIETPQAELVPLADLPAHLRGRPGSNVISRRRFRPGAGCAPRSAGACRPRRGTEDGPFDTELLVQLELLLGGPSAAKSDAQHDLLAASCCMPENPTGHHQFHPQAMLLCVSSRELVEVLLVALGEVGVVAQASFEG